MPAKLAPPKKKPKFVYVTDDEFTDAQRNAVDSALEAFDLIGNVGSATVRGTTKDGGLAFVCTVFTHRGRKYAVVNNRHLTPDEEWEWAECIAEVRS